MPIFPNLVLPLRTWADHISHQVRGTRLLAGAVWLARRDKVLSHKPDNLLHTLFVRIQPETILLCYGGNIP